MKSLLSLFRALRLLFDVFNQKSSVEDGTETDSLPIAPRDEILFKAIQADRRDLE